MAAIFRAVKAKKAKSFMSVRLEMPRLQAVMWINPMKPISSSKVAANWIATLNIAISSVGFAGIIMQGKVSIILPNMVSLLGRYQFIGRSICENVHTVC